MAERGRTVKNGVGDVNMKHHNVSESPEGDV